MMPVPQATSCAVALLTMHGMLSACRYASFASLAVCLQAAAYDPPLQGLVLAYALVMRCSEERGRVAF
jgi:hypothetical protein